MHVTSPRTRESLPGDPSKPASARPFTCSTHPRGSQPLIRRKRVFLKRLHHHVVDVYHIEPARPEAGNDGPPHSRSISRIALPDECVRKITRPRKGDWQSLTSWPRLPE